MLCSCDKTDRRGIVESMELVELIFYLSILIMVRYILQPMRHVEVIR